MPKNKVMFLRFGQSTVDVHILQEKGFLVEYSGPNSRNMVRYFSRNRHITLVLNNLELNNITIEI